ncbi:unnamed protein product [Blepharisma stoltei]|uniref:LITAF domain-containing protein n=1 Tax=Blepharisma stoltei TaxID=1481888 RepID=A0AAU9JRE6_9CILI|nr:unnamed protein product [Blepharisma stoltei]
MSKPEEEPFIEPENADNAKEAKDQPSQALKDEKGLSFYGVYHPEKQSKSESLLCPECHKQTWSRVESRPGKLTYGCCCYLCLIGWCLCLCYVPFCIKRCKDTYHFCANCNAPLSIN